MLALRATVALALAVATAMPAVAFDCVEKYCPQMESCAEAYYHLTVCGETKRDADNDGIPCENVCGKTPEEYRQRRGPELPQSPLVQQPALRAVPNEVPPAADPAFQCAGKRKCGDMASCEEARFYLSACGVRSLDRDGDGVPCESLCGGR